MQRFTLSTATTNLENSAKFVSNALKTTYSNDEKANKAMQYIALNLPHVLKAAFQIIEGQMRDRTINQKQALAVQQNLIYLTKNIKQGSPVLDFLNTLQQVNEVLTKVVPLIPKQRF